MRLIVFVSGNGSNLQAVIDAVQAGHLKAEIVLVVSNRRGAYGLERAATAGIPTLYFPLKPYTDVNQSRVDYDTDLAAAIAPYKPDLIVLAGWMHVLSPAFLDHYPRQVINLHPALPGQFAGTHAIQRAYEAFQRGDILNSGVMVHYVIPEVDAGEVLIKAGVPLLPEDTLEAFAERMHATEHQLLVKAIALHAQKHAR